MPTSAHFETLVRKYASAPINSFFDPHLVVERGKATITFDVGPRHHHGAHAVHGSVYFKALDDAAFFAANSLVEDVYVLTTSFTIHLTRPLVEGTITSVGRVVEGRKSFFFAESRLTGPAGELLAFGSGSFIRSKFPLDASVG